VRLQTLVVRHEPPGLDPAAIDAHTRAWAQAVNESGEGYLTPTVLSERWAVRVSLGTANTEHEHVADVWRLMQRCADA
jgi:aromatic-L-amino-acid decarboxylase